MGIFLFIETDNAGIYESLFLLEFVILILYGWKHCSEHMHTNSHLTDNNILE